MNVSTNGNTVTTGTRRPLFGITNTAADFRDPGEKLPIKERGWMTKADAKVSERIELSKGTIFLISIVPVFLMLIFSYGGSVIGWTREDQETRTKVEILSQQIQQVNSRIEQLNTKIDKMAEMQQQQAVKSATIEGFKTGVAASENK